MAGGARMHEGWMQTTEGKRSLTTAENRQRNSFGPAPFGTGKGKDRQASGAVGTHEQKARFWSAGSGRAYSTTGWEMSNPWDRAIRVRRGTRSGSVTLPNANPRASGSVV